MFSDDLAQTASAETDEVTAADVLAQVNEVLGAPRKPGGPTPAQVLTAPKTRTRTLPRTTDSPTRRALRILEGPTQRLRELVCSDSNEARNIRDAIAKTIVRKALDGDPIFMRLLLDRIDGPVVQEVKLDQTVTLQAGLAGVLASTAISAEYRVLPEPEEADDEPAAVPTISTEVQA